MLRLVSLSHELAHLYWEQLAEKSRDLYQLMTGWAGKSGHLGQRLDGYVEEDGRLSPGEDFANNVEYFLFEPTKLKKLTPGAFSWIEQRFGNNFKVGAGCE